MRFALDKPRKQQDLRHWHSLPLRRIDFIKMQTPEATEPQLESADHCRHRVSVKLPGAGALFLIGVNRTVQQQDHRHRSQIPLACPSIDQLQ